jgi:hypothetical protein
MDNPISPARFAAALQDLPLSSLALKVAELRNSIAHLDYSNEQLKPFAQPTSPQEQADADCVEAIHENEIVIKRMEERIQLVKTEVERRGASWREVGFMGTSTLSTDLGEVQGEAKPLAVNGHTITDEEVDDLDMDGNGIAPTANGTSTAANRGTEMNGADSTRHSAWTDGTFQTGRISAGQVIMDQNQVQSQTRRSGQEQGGQGGTLGDEELRRRLEERMREMVNNDNDVGMHL